MHEHVFVLNEEIRQNYPGDWDEAARIDDAVAKLTALAARGCQTIADPTVLGLGRDIGRIQQVAAGAGLNIIAATGLYTYNEVPLYFKFRGPAPADGLDPMAAMFIARPHRRDQRDRGQGGVPQVRHRRPGPDPRRRAGAARRRPGALDTGAPITVHTHPHSGTGRDVADPAPRRAPI